MLVSAHLICGVGLRLLCVFAVLSLYANGLTDRRRNVDKTLLRGFECICRLGRSECKAQCVHHCEGALAVSMCIIARRGCMWWAWNIRARFEISRFSAGLIRTKSLRISDG